MTGEVYLNGQKVVCEGLAFVFDKTASSLVLLYDAEDTEAAKIAKDVLTSATVVEEK